MRPHPLICVKDVEASGVWYQRLLGCESAHGGPECPDVLGVYDYAGPPNNSLCRCCSCGLPPKSQRRHPDCGFSKLDTASAGPPARGTASRRIIRSSISQRGSTAATSSREAGSELHAADRSSLFPGRLGQEFRDRAFRPPAQISASSSARVRRWIWAPASSFGPCCARISTSDLP